MKFTDAGGTVCVSVTRSETSVAVSVRDTGIGMDLTELAAMFEPFRQAASGRARSRGGLGLGLALSKGLIEKHGGAITAASEGPGGGSTFSIRLPLDREMSVELSPPAAQAVAAPQRRRILIVDDRRDARLTLSVLLERLGQQVAQADSGAGALDTAKSFHPEVVLCDIGLPDMDGYAVARAIRAAPTLQGVLLVALTGYGQAEDRAQALEAGFDEHLTKPVSVEQLRGLLLRPFAELDVGWALRNVCTLSMRFIAESLGSSPWQAKCCMVANQSPPYPSGSLPSASHADHPEDRWCDDGGKGRPSDSSMIPALRYPLYLIANDQGVLVTSAGGQDCVLLFHRLELAQRHIAEAKLSGPLHPLVIPDADAFREGLESLPPSIRGAIWDATIVPRRSSTWTWLICLWH